MIKQRIFRKSALDKLASPNTLDVLFVLVAPKTWLVVVATMILFISVITGWYLLSLDFNFKH